MLTLFDFDGTLSDTREAIVAGLRTLVTARLDDPPTDDVLIEHVSRGTGLHATIRSLHPAPASIEHEIEDWATHYRTAYGEHAPATERLYEGAADAVECAAELGKVVIVSMKHRDELERSIARLGLAPFIDAFFGDDDGITPLKPHVELWTEAIAPRFTQHEPGRTLMIGDTGHDLEFARNAGLQRCWAAYGYGNDAACLDVGFDYRADCATEMTAVLQEFSRQSRQSA